MKIYVPLLATKVKIAPKLGFSYCAFTETFLSLSSRDVFLIKMWKILACLSRIMSKVLTSNFKHLPLAVFTSQSPFSVKVSLETFWKNWSPFSSPFLIFGPFSEILTEKITPLQKCSVSRKYLFLNRSSKNCIPYYDTFGGLIFDYALHG